MNNMFAVLRRLFGIRLSFDLFPVSIYYECKLIACPMNTISELKSIKVLNSRGDWTIKTYLKLKEGGLGWCIVPEGASKGEHEAVCLDADQAVKKVEEVLTPKIVGKSFSTQKELDEFLIGLDGTQNKSNLGGNVTLAVSIAFARALSQIRGVELWKSLISPPLENAKRNITPLFNVLNGGKHAQNNLAFQEFMLIPSKKYSFLESVEMGRTVYKSLKNRLEKDGFSTGVGDEGGFAPEGFTVRKALEYVRSCAAENYKVGSDVFFGMDVAAESFYSNGKYIIKEEGLELTSEEFLEYLASLLDDFEIIYIEDLFHEKDVTYWQRATERFGSKVMVSADDLVVTNPAILAKAIKSKLANTVIVKPNQVGTLWETMQFVKEARAAGWGVVASHRSGDTEDPFIADVAYAINADFVKFGAPDRGERTSKFNRILELV